MLAPIGLAFGVREMRILVWSLVVIAALAVHSPQSASGQESVEDTGPPGGSPPILIEFTGVDELVIEAGRQGMLTQVLNYTLTVDDVGKAVGCKFNRKFRRKSVEISFCRVLKRHHSFEPARDCEVRPVFGTYTGTIDFQTWVKGD
ncbi:hypothetical protein WAB17_13385 [Parerythrobacter aurantius]|uniref:hypothetical protein n=1 Tax=Parerythrobacter aurantius TaxID=3127706 RepID=UPI0032552949